MAKSKIKKVGRPSIMSLEIIGKLLQGFKIGYNDAECCAYVGISKDTYYEFRKKNKKFSDDVDNAKEYPFQMAKHTIAKNLNKPEIAKWYLEKRRRNEFGDIKKIELDTTDKFEKMSVEEKLAALEANED